MEAIICEGSESDLLPLLLLVDEGGMGGMKGKGGCTNPFMLGGGGGRMERDAPG